MKKYLLGFIIIMLFSSCEKEEKEEPISPPVANFTMSESTITVGKMVYFENTSTNSPTSIAWDFENGSPAIAFDDSPRVRFNSSGVFEVKLTATNGGGIDTKTKYITVEKATIDLNIYNNTFTDMTITVNSSTKTIYANDYITISDLDYYKTISYSAQTSGHTSSGSIIGLPLEWDGTVYLGTQDYDLDLNVGPDFFFLYLTNSGNNTLSPIYVNYGLLSETVDYVSLPNNGVKYRVGYYKAFSNGNVRAYNTNNSSSYVYWKQGNHYNLPWSNNQSANLSSSSLKKGKTKPILLNNDVQELIPEKENNNILSIPENAIKVYAKEKK